MGRELVDELRPVTGLAGEQPEDGQFEDALAQLGAPGFLFGTHSFNVIPASMRNKLGPPPRGGIPAPHCLLAPGSGVARLWGRIRPVTAATWPNFSPLSPAAIPLDGPSAPGSAKLMTSQERH